MIKTVLAAAGVALALTGFSVSAAEVVEPDSPSLYIISPENGAHVTSPVTVRFGLKGMGVAPAGVDKPNTGHHHLLIDVDPATIDLENAVPADEQHIHFGGGQTEADVVLSPGEHTLRLLLGDMNHIPLDPPGFSAPVTITVDATE